MTNERRLRELAVLVKQRETDGSHARARAVELLIAEGIYSSDGRISPNYGGDGVGTSESGLQ